MLSLIYIAPVPGAQQYSVSVHVLDTCTVVVLCVSGLYGLHVSKMKVNTLHHIHCIEVVILLIHVLVQCKLRMCATPDSDTSYAGFKLTFICSALYCNILDRGRHKKSYMTCIAHDIHCS